MLGVPLLGGPSEREYREKLNKIREKLRKKAKNVRNDFAKIEKMKVEALKKTEEVRRSIDHDVDRIEKDVVKSRDLAPESKQRLQAEIMQLKGEVGDSHAELRTRISETLIPSPAEQISY